MFLVPVIPQDLRTSASPTFNSLILGDGTADTALTITFDASSDDGVMTYNYGADGNNFNFGDTGFITTDTITTKYLTLTAPSSQNYKFTTFSGSSNQLAFESQANSNPFNLNIFTKDGNGTDSVFMFLRGVGTVSGGITNSELLGFGYVGSTTPANRYCFILSDASGSGTTRPLIIYTGGNSNQLYLKTNGNVGIGRIPTTYKFEVGGDIWTNTIVYAGNFNWSSAQQYTLTDWSSDRTLDADSDTLESVADVLATLINDLADCGILTVA